MQTKHIFANTVTITSWFFLCHGVTIYADKCKLDNYCSTNYYLSKPTDSSRSLVSRVTEEKYLGIWCTSDMKLSLQVQKAVAKAMQSLGIMKRSFSFYEMIQFYFCIRSM